MRKPYHIVLTTIYEPVILSDILINVREHGHLEKTKIWVIGDRKTPGTAEKLANEISAAGLETVYMDIETQDQWGMAYKDFYSRLPYNNQTRRNVGYLRALEDGCETLIILDDDNFPTEDDFIGCHSITGSSWEGKLISEPSGFHNICEYIDFEPSRHIYARGFPFDLRDTRNTPSRKPAHSPVSIGANEGLWLRDPDIDATTRLNGKVSGVKYKGDFVQVLHQDTWTPINTQNTSVTRELIPAFLAVPMGWDVPGGKIDWYSDIWGGYFLQALMRSTKYHVAFGRPLVDQRRNPHNHLDDLRREFWGIMMTDWVLKMLREDFMPTSPNLLERIHELGDCLEKKSRDSMPSWTPDEMKNFMINTAGTLRYWSQACERAM